MLTIAELMMEGFVKTLLKFLFFSRSVSFLFIDGGSGSYHGRVYEHRSRLCAILGGKRQRHFRQIQPRRTLGLHARHRADHRGAGEQRHRVRSIRRRAVYQLCRQRRRCGAPGLLGKQGDRLCVDRSPVDQPHRAVARQNHRHQPPGRSDLLLCPRHTQALRDQPERRALGANRIAARACRRAAPRTRGRQHSQPARTI